MTQKGGVKQEKLPHKNKEVKVSVREEEYCIY